MATTSFVLVPPTGILAAIEMHRAAWSHFQIAPEGTDSDLAWIAMEEALDALVAHPCRTQDEVRALAAYLFWYVHAERHTRDWTQGSEAIALARASDLALLLDEPQPAALAEVNPASLGFLASRVVRRLSQAGELLACLVLIGGGMAATGFASLLG
jgi:hypothetical protein